MWEAKEKAPSWRTEALHTFSLHLKLTTRFPHPAESVLAVSQAKTQPKRPLLLRNVKYIRGFHAKSVTILLHISMLGN